MIYWANIRSIVYFIILYVIFLVCFESTHHPYGYQTQIHQTNTKWIFGNKTDSRPGLGILYIWGNDFWRVNIVRSCQVRSCCFVSYHTSYCYLPRLAIFLDLRWVIAPLILLNYVFNTWGEKRANYFMWTIIASIFFLKFAMHID